MYKFLPTTHLLERASVEQVARLMNREERTYQTPCFFFKAEPANPNALEGKWKVVIYDLGEDAPNKEYKNVESV